MQQLDLVMTKSYSALFGAGLDSSANINTEGSPQNWQNLLPKSQDQSRVNLVLGPPYISFISLTLPPIKKQKLRQVVRFELENYLLAPVEEYLWDYTSYLDKENKQAIVLVYFVERESLQKLEAECKEKGWEVEQVLAWQNILDLNSRKDLPTERGVHLLFDASTVYFLYYEQGQLKDLSWLQIGENWYENLQRLNSQLKAIYLQSQAEAPLTLSPNVQSLLEVNQSGELSLKADAKTFQFQAEPFTLSPSFKTGQSLAQQSQPQQGLVSLSKVKGKLFLHWKEQAIRFKKAGILLALFLSLFALGSGYQLWLDHNQLAELTQQRDKVARRYIPNVAGKKALRQIELALQQGASSKNTTATFQEGAYPAIQLLGQVSSLQGQAESLQVSRFGFTMRTYTLQGQVKSLAELESMKGQLQKWYPASQYEVRFQQKTEPDGVTRFIVSIEKKRAKR